jgi:hypothetical protein
MGVITTTIYKMFPGIEEAEKEIEKTIYAGKKAIDNCRKVIILGKNVGEYIDSGKPLGYVDKSMDVFTKGMNKAFTGAFKEMINDFTKKYGPYGLGGSFASKASQPIITTQPGSGEAARRFFVNPKGEVTIEETAAPSQPYKPGNGKEQGSQPYAGHKPLGHDYMKGLEKEAEVSKPVVKPAEQPAKPIVEQPAIGPAAIPQPVVKPAAKPVVKPVEKQLTLDSIVEDFKRKLKALSPDIDVGVDVYAPGGLLRSYASKYHQEKAEEVADVVADAVSSLPRAEAEVEAKASGLESKVSALKDKYAVNYTDVKSSKDVLDLYNKGYKAKEIIRESSKNGYRVKSYKDVISNVASAIAAGASYVREKYNNLIATALGATEQLINDYLSGKSYAEIKENLKKSTNGMNVSDSSILRVMHNYEAKSGAKVVGKRNGKAKAKNSSAKPGSKAAKAKK